MTVNANSTVRDLATGVPGATRVFESLGIDYCCGGGKPLTEACSSAGVALDQVVLTLEQAAIEATQKGDDRDWSRESLTTLVSFIVDTHHAFDRQELDRIEPLLAKVVSVYREPHPYLIDIQRVFLALKADLLNHMMKEELVLFPYINALQEATDRRASKPFPPFGTVRNPVRMMMVEHDAAGEMLRKIRELSSDFTPPEDACVSYRALYEAFEGLERDLHRHIHLENNILFPRAIEMEE
ncbi:MAG TPA: iron-sulfur cluster repair di-iron protein [Blastocatellia bacterium]|nr:iron-sulfur cluster repair di-iron protein [Blastocatellia bacterium]